MSEPCYGFLNFDQNVDQRYDEQGPKHAKGKGDAPRGILKGGAGKPTTDDIPVLSNRKAFVYIGEDVDVQANELAVELETRWAGKVIPDAIVSFVSGTNHFHNWKREDNRSALQTGIVKLLSALDLVIIDDGLNYGISQLLANAIDEEENYRSYASKTVQAGPRKPGIIYIGIVPLDRTDCADRFSHLSAHDNEVDMSYRSRDRTSSRIQLSRYHSHFIIIDKSYENASLLRVEIEKSIQHEIGIRESMADDVSDKAYDQAEATFIPHVVFFFQGEVDELERIRAYVRLRIPIIIMNGCGGMADVLGFAIKNSTEPDEYRMRANLTTRLTGALPPNQRKNEELVSESVEKLIEIVSLGGSPQGNLLTVVDCGRADTFGALDVPLLQAIITSSAERHLNSDQLTRNMKLCIMCNKPDVAQASLLTRPPWSQVPYKPPYNGFTASLILPGREQFIDLFLQLKFPVRFYTSYVDLLLLFRKAVGKEIFTSLVWDDILGHNQTDPVREEFILAELNPLIQKLTGIRNYLDLHELTRVALTRDDRSIDPVAADAKALSALTVFAVLLNRAKLVKVFLKYSTDPVPTAVFIETMYRGLYRETNNMDLRMGLKRQADEFGEIATSILDAGIREAPDRAKSFFQRTIPDYNNRTTLEMAFDARNKKLIAHPVVQGWLDNFSYGYIRVTGAHPTAKLLLSAYLIFPMYIWLSFPRLVNAKSNYNQAKEAEYIYEPRSAEEALDILTNLNKFDNNELSRKVYYKEPRPPIYQMIYAVWEAPVVKFYTWFIIYIMFLIVIGTDMMMPACTALGLDIAVFVLIMLLWLELVTRTGLDYVWKRRSDWYLRTIDFVYQTVFIILFFLYRIAPYRWAHPFAGRVILAFGVMYYFYGVWIMFYTFSRQLGPLVRICIIMFQQDLPKWLIMMVPFFVSTGVVWQAISTPDWPFTGDDWRKALYRATFTVWGAFYSDLEYTDRCEKPGVIINWSNFTQPASADPQDRCWLGDYTDHTCPTVSFWAYFFVLNYYFFLKLGMMVVLVVFYIFRQTIEMPKADLIWRYYRFDTIFDYYGRSALPFPLNIFGNLYLIAARFTSKKPVEAKADPEYASQLDTFIFWKSKAAEYFAKKDKEDGARGLPMKQNAILGGIKGELQSILNRFGEVHKRLADVDQDVRDTGHKLRNTTGVMLRQGSAIAAGNIPFVACPVPHRKSRESPYAGTQIRRFFVPDNKIDWSIPFDNYKPEAFSQPLEQFSPEEQEFVDPELRDLKSSEMRSRAASIASGFVGPEWNSVEYHDGSAINRKTWIVDESHDPIMYSVDSTGAPLNPHGRCGLRGRGFLGRYGPNHRIVLLATAEVNKSIRYVVQTMPGSSTASLPNIPLCHYESEYSVAAVLFSTFFAVPEKELEDQPDPGLCTSDEQLSKFMSDLVRKQWRRNSANYSRTAPALHVEELYRGYLDAHINTDNGWMEVIVFHTRMPQLALDASSNFRWKTFSAAESILPEFDAAVLKFVAT